MLKTAWDAKNLIASTLTASFLMEACGGTLGGNPERQLESPTAPISFSITDAAIDDAKNVFVIIESLDVKQEGKDWLKIPLKVSSEFDLLALHSGATQALAGLPDLPYGTYTQTRLILDSSRPARLIDAQGAEHVLTVPSGSETGLKINTAFVVDSQNPVNLTIDFDLRKSIKKVGHASRGKYMMNPVLRLLRDEATGTVIGQTSTGATVCLFANNVVKAESNDCEQAESSAISREGKFKLAFIPAGSYHLRIFTLDGQKIDLADVQVSAGQDIDVGKR